MIFFKERKAEINSHSQGEGFALSPTSQPIRNRSIAEAKELVNVIHNTKFLTII